MTTQGSSATNESTTGCNFICSDVGACSIYQELGGAARCSQCDPFFQDCPGEEKCVAYDSDGDDAPDSTKCVMVTGDGQHGDECTSEGASNGADSCAKGLMCWHLNEQNMGTCVELCTGAADAPQCAPPNTTCMISNYGSLTLCISDCDPIAQDCAAGYACVSNFANGFGCILDAFAETKPLGSPCEFLNDCDIGDFCADPEFAPAPECVGANGCCAAFCNLSDGDEPCQQLNPMFSCVPWYTEGQAPAQYDHVGGCGLAPP
jgi:hypothetical protein